MADSYRAIHKWIARNYGKADKCVGADCKGMSKKYEWALIKGNSHGRDINSYMMLCRSCHGIYDMTDQNRERKRKSMLGKNLGRVTRTTHLRLSICDDLGNVYHSVTQAAELSGISRRAISNNLNNRSKSAGGRVWNKTETK